MFKVLKFKNYGLAFDSRNLKPIARWLHRFVANPWVYDLSQKLAGGDVTRAVLKKEFSILPNTGSALDVGGGTGLMRSLLPETWEYTCLDNDPKKLNSFQKKFPKDDLIKASATKIPKPSSIYDLCILSAVSHHLQGSELDCALKEISRVLRPTGQLLFLDALLNPDNLAGKILWSLDRGNFPRALSDLKRHLENSFVITKSKTWKVFHEYALLICSKKPS